MEFNAINVENPDMIYDLWAVDVVVASTSLIVDNGKCHTKNRIAFDV